MWVGDQKLMVAIKRDTSTRPPLLLFNGIGANWELAAPFLEALTDTTAIIFDLPGVGGSPLSALPYRPSSIARLSARLVADLGYDRIDVAGVSWGRVRPTARPIHIRRCAGGWCSPPHRRVRSWYPDAKCGAQARNAAPLL